MAHFNISCTVSHMTSHMTPSLPFPSLVVSVTRVACYQSDISPKSQSICVITNQPTMRAQFRLTAQGQFFSRYKTARNCTGFYSASPWYLTQKLYTDSELINPCWQQHVFDIWCGLVSNPTYRPAGEDTLTTALVKEAVDWRSEVPSTSQMLRWNCNAYK